MTDGSPLPQPAAIPQAAPTAQTIEFDHAAMLMGRSLYWNTAPQEHVAGINALLRWCLTLPEARLGVSLTGVLQIVQSLVKATSPLQTPEIAALLGRFGVDLRSLPAFPLDDKVWGPHVDMLLGWVRRATRPDDYVWLEGDDAERWIAATMQSLTQYNNYLDSNIPAGVRLQLMSRHTCALFAPFDGAAMWDQMSVLASTLESPSQERLQNLLNDPQFARDQLAGIGSVFWTWRPLNFADADGSIICTPILSLWNAYPSDPHSAPPSLAEFAPRARYSTEGVAHLLVDVYWVVLETIFNAVRQSCGLGVAEPEFNEIESRPPVFFFAAPVAPPALPEEYASTWRRAIYPLIKSCLVATDPLTDQIAWGLLEGDQVVLRREMSSRRSYQSRYLVLPTIPKSTSSGPIEEDIGDIADRLTYLEFTVGHEARDVYTDMDPLAVHSSMWGGTLDRVGDVTDEAMDLLPRLSRGNIARVSHHLADLKMVLQRMQRVVEDGSGSAKQVERTYNSYIDGTDDFMRRVLTSSSVPHSTAQSLRDAMLHAYPYQYVKQPLESLQSVMSSLSGDVDRIVIRVDSALDHADRLERSRLARLGIVGGVLVVLFTLLGLIPQFVSAQPEGTSAATPTTLPSLVADYIPPSILHASAHLLFFLIATGLFVTVLTYLYTWISQRFFGSQDGFVVGVRQVRELVEQAQQGVLRARSAEDALASALLAAASGAQDEHAAAAALAVARAQRDVTERWSDLDRLDGEATNTLAQLWMDLRRPADGSYDGKKRSTRTWATRALILEHMIELFDLSPTPIPLPRMLCVLRFKSTDFRERTTVADWDFESSLEAVRFAPREVKLLDGWLSALGNPEQIKNWDVATFVRVLAEHGVSASPALRKPNLWQGSLEGADKAPAART